MEMINRAARTVALAAMLLVVPVISHADLIEIEGELTTSDFLARDTMGEFYYDFFEFVSAGTNPITITLESGDFLPYLAWGFGIDLPPWPDGSDDPYFSFIGEICLGAPGSDSLTIDNPTDGQGFQVVVATCNYNHNDAALGAYSLTIDDRVAQVPEPGTLALFGIGLLGLAAARRRKLLV